MDLARIILLVVAASVSLGAATASLNRTDGMERTYNDLVAADNWRDAKAVSERLGEFGDEAIPFILKGTRHEAKMVREYCYEVLRAKFPMHPQSVPTIIRGLHDKEPMISYPCAFHLGEHKISEAREALKTCIQDETRDSRTKYAAAKSLAELGDRKIMVMLYEGLGSDDAYTRYLSNIGVMALCGKDLANFGYEGPWEGASVSGPAVITLKGQPIEKAKKRLGRWQAIVAFLEWLKKDKPELFHELDNLW